MDDQNLHANCGGIFNEIKPYVLMVSLQFGTAGTYIISTATLNHGMSRYVLIVYRNTVAALVLAPFALILERKIRPKMTLPVLLQITALGFLEPILDQGFAYLGMQYTSASYTSAIMNAVPSVTFILALICRMEKVNLKERRSQAKVAGTIVTFGGALLMTLYKGPVLNFLCSSRPSQHSDATASSTKHWVSGTVFILLGCVAWSAFFILQSVTVKKYPAELSLSSLICLSGAMQSTVVALALEHSPEAWSLGWNSRLLAPLYTGIVSSGVTYYVQGLVLKTRGPVFVTAFNPLCMILVSIMGSLILLEKLHLGSIVGGIIIALGLYGVVWGKSKDYSNLLPPTNSEKACPPQELPLSSADVFVKK